VPDRHPLHRALAAARRRDRLAQRLPRHRARAPGAACQRRGAGLAAGAHRQPLQRDLQLLLQRDLRLENDANCLALSEATDGAGAGADVVFAAILGTGTGAGIAVHGRVLRGPNGLAGEWGHNPLPWAVPGRPAAGLLLRPAGCIETLVSGPGLARDHQRRVTGAT
jgi:predicted NBD/HSP70 family sugar kinase